MSSPSPILHDMIRQGREGYRVIFTNGVFDLLHPGHLKLLRHCRSLAGEFGVVVVGLNSDESVGRLKGPGRPIMDLSARREIVGAIKGVDWVFSFDEDTPLELIKVIRPNVIVKGDTYRAEDVVGFDLAHVELVPTRMVWEWKPEDTSPCHLPPRHWSTTSIIERIRNG